MINLPADIKEFFRKAGSIGGKAAAKQMSKADKVRRAKKAVAAREAKRKKGKPAK